MSQAAKRVMSGMRPTGRLHLGHAWGVLNNWVQLQNQYDCYFSIADWHALTTKAFDTKQLRQHTHELALDWLAAGVDPDKATLFVQSSVPQVAQLHVLLSMLTPLKWVETDPTLKDMVALGSVDIHALAGIFFVIAVLESSNSFVYVPVLRASFLEPAPPAHKCQHYLIR
jgi:tryptophanyl-tRNA synthetase